MNTAVETLFIDHTELVRQDVQFKLRGAYIDHVTKAAWPKATGALITGIKSPRSQESLGYEERTYSLLKSAIESPSICMHDFKFGWQVDDALKNTVRIFVESLQYIWKTTFRRDIINTIRTRAIAPASKFNGPFLADPIPRRVNFFGKEVSAYKTTPAGKSYISPKYKRAATQYVEFHPDIVHFLFPDLEKWAGGLAWRNIPDLEFNRDGDIGFYRMLMTYAAKPIHPELGKITTVPPPGFIGTLWYWAWKLVGFVP